MNVMRLISEVLHYSSKIQCSFQQPGRQNALGNATSHSLQLVFFDLGLAINSKQVKNPVWDSSVMWLADDRKHKNHLRIFSQANKPASHQLETCGPRSKSKATSSHLYLLQWNRTLIHLLTALRYVRGLKKVCSAICSLNRPEGRQL